MAYTEQNWENGSAGGTPISAARLNHMEAGIGDAADAADAAASAISSHVAAADPHPQYISSATQVVAGSGLTGGGDLSESRTLTLDQAVVKSIIAASLAAGTNVTLNTVSGVTTISAATDPEVVRDTIGTALVAGTNVTITPNDGSDTITISSTTDPEVVRDTIGATLVAGANMTITVNDTANTITLDSSGGGSTDAEIVRDTIGSTLVAGAGIGIVVDDAGNTITINNTSGSAAYNVDISPVDSTGTIAMDTQIATAISTVNSLYSTARGSHTVSLRFAPGNFRITNPNIFDALTISSAARRSVTITGPTELGKRATLLIFASTVTASKDQTVGCLFRFVNQRQFTVRDIGFRSENANQTLFYGFCTTGSDEGGLYPEFPVSTAQNSGRWRRIYVEGDWKVVWGIDGGIRANLNSEMAFADWTFSNSLTASDAVFKFGYPLRDAVFLSTGISAPTAGTYTFTYNGQTTSSIAYNASAATVQSAIGALSNVGSGNVTVTASSNPTAGSYVVKFTNALAGVVDTSLISVTTTGWGGLSWKVFRFPVQQGQFLNYSFMDNEFEYATGDLFQINRGGYISFSGYHSVILGTSGGSGGTVFVMPEIATHPDNCCTLAVYGGFRPELRVSTAKFIDCNWHGVNKHILMHNVDISVDAISGGNTGSTVRAMEVIRFGNNVDAQQMPVQFVNCEFPGYVTIANATTGANGGDIVFDQVRFKSWTTPTMVKFADQTALAADTVTAVRVLGSGKVYNRGSYGTGGAAWGTATSVPSTDGSVSL